MFIERTNERMNRKSSETKRSLSLLKLLHHISLDYLVYDILGFHAILTSFVKATVPG